MKYLHDPVECEANAGPMEVAPFTAFVIGFIATEVVCAAVILEKMPACDFYDPCGACLCNPGPVD